jgi:phosphatidate cytidylyltransferase
MTFSPPAEPPAPAAPRKAFDWKNLRLRILSAAVLVPVALVCVIAGGPLFLLLLSIAMALLASEWAKMCAPVAVSRSAALLAAAVLASLLLAYASRVSVGWAALPLGAVLAALVAGVAGWAPRRTDVGFGVLYLGAPSLALLWLREDAPTGLFSHGHVSLGGLNWTMMLLLSTWASDIGAFAGGSVFKGPKLWPRISPNKTWSGFASGLLAAGVAAGLLWFWRLQGPGGLSAIAAIGIGIGAGLATMGGDLLESMLKRRFGVKDSGDLIPGHGGLLDRVDGMMAAALAVAGARLLVQAGVIS